MDGMIIWNVEIAVKLSGSRPAPLVWVDEIPNLSVVMIDSKSIVTNE